MADGLTTNVEASALIDVGAVARLLGVGERYVRRLVFERQIEFVKVGHYVRFDPQVVREWIERRRQPVASATGQEGRPGIVHELVVARPRGRTH